MPTPADVEALYDLFADAEVMHGLGKEPVSALEEARAMIEDGIREWRTEGVGPFILETTAAGRQVVGIAGLMIYDTRGWTPSTLADAGSHAAAGARLGAGTSALGARICDRSRRRHPGLGLRGSGRERLVSLITPDNGRSQRVAERLGATPAETITPCDSKRTAVVWRYPPAA